MSGTLTHADGVVVQPTLPTRRVSRYQSLRHNLSSYNAPERNLVFGEYMLIWLQRFTFCVRFRFVYPFLPVIATSLGVSVGETANAIAFAEGIAMICPLLAPFGDVFGHKVMLNIAGIVCTIGCLLPAIYLNYWSMWSIRWDYLGMNSVAFLVSSILCTLSFYINNSSTQALLNQLSKKKKTVSKMTGIKETAHAMAALIGFPVLGLLFTYTSLQVVFMVMTGLCLITFPLIILFLPPSPCVCAGAEKYDPPRPKYTSQEVFPNLLVRLRRVLSTPMGLGPLMFVIGLGLAGMYTASAFGLLLSTQFSMNSSEIGYVTIAIGVAELVADMTSLLVARCASGSPTLVVLSLCFAATCIGGAFLVPLGVIWTVVTVWLHTFFFEWMFVVGLTLFVKSLPEASNTFLSLTFLAMSIARMTVFLSIDPVWEWSGWWSTSLLTSIFAMAAIIPMGWTILYRSRRIKSGKFASDLASTLPPQDAAVKLEPAIPSSDSSTSDDTGSTLPSLNYDSSIPQVQLDETPSSLRVSPFAEEIK